MPFLTEADVRRAARETRSHLVKSYSEVLDESARTDADDFDIFLRVYPGSY